jgi:uncharacterized membrane protein (DUF373 family)
MPSPDKIAHRIVDVSDIAVHWIEAFTAVMLAVLAAVGAVFLVMQMGVLFKDPGIEALQSIFGAILLVFILIELYSIGTAFVRGGDVTNKIFEVGLVALVRQVIVAEFMHLTAAHMLTIGALIVALGLSWFLSRMALSPRFDATEKGAGAAE